jgi:hypothetical protein
MTKALLIGGTSHLGKSTLAEHLAGRLGWGFRSTDYLKRHPGRPWRRPPETVPPHVAEHYRELDVEALMASVLAHYRSLRPQIEALIGEADGLVLEGSALLPEIAASVRAPAVWLIGSDGLIERRIRTESGYAEAAPEQRRLIDKFIARSLAFNALVRGEVARLGLAHIVVESELGVDELAGNALSVAKATR